MRDDTHASAWLALEQSSTSRGGHLAIAGSVLAALAAIESVALADQSERALAEHQPPPFDGPVSDGEG